MSRTLALRARALASRNLVGTHAGAAPGLGNTGDGIAVTGAVQGPAVGGVLRQNVVVSNGRNGILLGSGSTGFLLIGNHVGLHPTAGAMPNARDGVRIFGSTLHRVGTADRGNTISGNLQSGIAVGGAQASTWSSDVTIAGNRIGTDAAGQVAVANGAYGIATVGRGRGHVVGGPGPAAGNVVSGNGLGGIALGDRFASVRNNRVGTTADGLAALPNGGAPPSAQLHFGGILVTGAPDPDGSRIALNLVSGNAGAGIWLRDTGDGDVTGHVVQENLVGTDVTGLAPLGNAWHGIFVEGASETVVGDYALSGGLGNTVAANGGDGIAIAATACPTFGAVCTAAVDNLVRGNLVGPDRNGLAPPGNDGDGISIWQNDANLAARDNVVEDNQVFGNGGIGIRLAAGNPQNGTDLNLVTHNTIHGNGACAFRVEHGDQSRSNPPTITSVSATEIHGIAPPGAGIDAYDHVEIYTDDGTEAGEFLGDAVPSGGFLGAFTQVGTNFPPFIAEIRAVAITTTGRSSGMSSSPADGCGTSASCDDGEECTFEYLDPVTQLCVYGHRPAGWRCSDDDPCTGIITPATYDPDTCDGAGACVPGPEITQPQVECPFATACNVATCDRMRGGCEYAAIPGDGFCAVDDLDEVRTNGSTCDPTGDCDTDGDGMVGGDPTNDDNDGDGIPNAWEVGDLDWDCDGRSAPIEGTDLVTGPYDADLNEPEVFVEVDWMAESCPPPPGGHSHYPDAAWVTEIQARFGEQRGITLYIDVDDCIPESTLISFTEATTPSDPDCNGLDDHTNLDDLRARYFTPQRRGVYHYGVMGHSSVGGYADATGLDGVCDTGADPLGGEGGGHEFYLSTSGGAEMDGSAFLHELGHTLGLGHGGDTACNKKPNYQSRMNYLYKPGLLCDPANAPGDCGTLGVPSVVPGRLDELNYSREDLADVFEGAVVEQGGGVASSDARYLLEWICTDASGAQTRGVPASADGSDWVDYDCDGAQDNPSPVDLNPDYASQCGGALTVLTGYDDWSNLDLFFQCRSSFGQERPDSEAAPEPEQGLDSARRAGALVPPRHGVRVDVGPGCDANPVPLAAVGEVEVVLYGDADLAVDELVPAFVAMHGAPARRMALVDVDEDGHLDARVAFALADLGGLSPEATRATVTGRLASSQVFTAWEAIVRADPQDVPCP